MFLLSSLALRSYFCFHYDISFIRKSLDSSGLIDILSSIFECFVTISHNYSISISNIEIIDFSNVINNAPVEDLDITIGINESKNRFRKDEVKEFEDTDALLFNGQGIQQNMYKLPKVVQ